MRIIIDYKNNTGTRIDEFILSEIGYIHITGTNIKIKWQN